MVILIIAYTLMALTAIVLLATKHSFDRRRDSIGQRILVVGNEDKSAAKDIAALLREAGIRTFGRVSTPRQLTLPDGQEARIERTKLLHMPDWSRLLRSFAARRADAVVYSHSSIGRGLRGRLELLFLSPTIVVVTGHAGPLRVSTAPRRLLVLQHLTGQLRAIPFGTTTIRQTATLPAAASVAVHLGISPEVIEATRQRQAAAPAGAGPMLVYTTRTKVRQRLHAIIDKLDNAHASITPR